MTSLWLYISVPVAGFRVAQAREYWETYPLPPPATVYGMLLSLVGESDRLRHIGAELAIALVSHPQRSIVLRTLWRIKSLKFGLGIGSNKRPDFQELLTDVCLSVWVRQGATEASPSLYDLLAAALAKPGGIRRFGGLSLGESTHLVDEIRPWKESDPAKGSLLIEDADGDLSLPIWADHVGSSGTRWGQYRLRQETLAGEPRKGAWIAINRPD